MIEFKNFSVDGLYENVNISFASKEISALIGVNAIGKSTLMKYILGLFNDYEGEIIIDGVVMTDDNYHQIQKKISLCHDEYQVQTMGFTIEDEVLFKHEQCFKGDYQEKISFITEFLNLSASYLLSDLTPSQLQVLIILNSLTSGEEILLLDEAIVHINQDLKNKLFAYLQSLDITILIATNNYSDLKYIDAIYEIKDLDINKRDDKDQFEALVYCNEKPEKVNEIWKTDGQKITDVYEQISFYTDEKMLSVLLDLGLRKKNYYFEEEMTVSCITMYPLYQIMQRTVKEFLSKYDRIELMKVLKQFNLDAASLEMDIEQLSKGTLVKVLLVDATLSKTDAILMLNSLEFLDEETKIKVMHNLKNSTKVVLLYTTNEIEGGCNELS